MVFLKIISFLLEMTLQDKSDCVDYFGWNELGKLMFECDLI
jgi:hypothetical protein